MWRTLWIGVWNIRVPRRQSLWRFCHISMRTGLYSPWWRGENLPGKRPVVWSRTVLQKYVHSLNVGLHGISYETGFGNNEFSVWIHQIASFNCYNKGINRSRQFLCQSHRTSLWCPTHLNLHHAWCADVWMRLRDSRSIKPCYLLFLCVDRLVG